MHDGDRKPAHTEPHFYVRDELKYCNCSCKACREENGDVCICEECVGNA